MAARAHDADKVAEHPGGVALVVGAGGGVGRAIALALAEAGYRMALVDRDASRLAATSEAVSAHAGHAATPLSAAIDATDTIAVSDLCVRILAELGTVDVLVNAAGIYGERRSFAQSDPALWWQVMEANVKAPMVCTRAVLGAMVAKGQGYVINISSRASTWDDPGASSVAYSTSKAALCRFTSSLAAELAGTGVVVVDLSPGAVLTGMTASRPDIGALAPDAFLPASAVAGRAVELVSGRYDELHGRFVHARDDLDDLVSRLRSSPAARRLTLAPIDEGDPVA